MPRKGQSRNKPIIGLTGGIGAGKSTVAGLLKQLGAAVIDADQLCHEQLSIPAVSETLQEWWGRRILTDDGQVDRQAVASIVFSAPEQLCRLEDLLYPRIHKEREKLASSYMADANVKAIVFDIPKLVETGLDEECDAIIFVEVDAAIRLERIRSARRWEASDLQQREKLLDPLDKKRAIADYVVINNSTETELLPQLKRILSAVQKGFS